MKFDLKLIRTCQETKISVLFSVQLFDAAVTLTFNQERQSWYESAKFTKGFHYMCSIDLAQIIRPRGWGCFFFFLGVLLPNPETSQLSPQSHKKQFMCKYVPTEKQPYKYEPDQVSAYEASTTCMSVDIGSRSLKLLW